MKAGHIKAPIVNMNIVSNEVKNQTQFQKRLMNSRQAEIGVIKSNKQTLASTQQNKIQSSQFSAQTQAQNYNEKKIKKQNQYILNLAAETGNTQSLADIVNKDKYGDFAADINSHNKEDWTTLHTAASEGHFEIVQLILDKNGEIDPIGRDNRTPLHIACLRGKIEIARLLVQRGAKVNIQDIDGNTSTHFASVFGHREILQLLLSHNSDITLKNNLGKTPYDICSSNRIFKIFEDHLQKQCKQGKEEIKNSEVTRTND